VAPEPAVAERAPLPPDAPVEDVVALANQRRKEKRWRAADSLYERVMRESAGTDAAAIATVASAALHLDHLADPAGALRRFQKALRLRPGGPLAEEARWGLAETHRALGDDAAERAALRGFLSAHPRSVNAARARQRLAELGAAP
jgi:tetratricopeptide (TPR) repeat protein